MLTAGDYLGIAGIMFAAAAIYMLWNMREYFKHYFKHRSVLAKNISEAVKPPNPQAERKSIMDLLRPGNKPLIVEEPAASEGFTIKVEVPRTITVKLNEKDLLELILKNVKEKPSVAEEEKEEKEEQGEAKPTEEKELKELLIKGKVPKG